LSSLEEHSAVPIPSHGAGKAPVFREPWEAHAFAIVLMLHERGLFTWREWASTLAAQITRAQKGGDADLGDTYYRHWLSALEFLVAEKGASCVAELTRYQLAWDHAAGRTPHGQAIELQTVDFADEALSRLAKLQPIVR
jgi:nitrile hydratase accessory protein